MRVNKLLVTCAFMPVMVNPCTDKSNMSALGPGGVSVLRFKNVVK